MLAPGSFVLLSLNDVLKREPAWSLNLQLQDEELQHTLLSAKDGLKRVAGQIGWQRRHRGRVLDLQYLVLAMLQWRLEAILSVDTFALEHRDILESALANLLKLRVNVRQVFVLLLNGEGSTGLAAHLWDSVHSPLHAIDFKRAGYVLVQLWLPHLAEKEEFSAVLLFVRVDPEERQGAIRVQGQRQVLAIQSLVSVSRPYLIVQVQVLLL